MADPEQNDLGKEWSYHLRTISRRLKTIIYPVVFGHPIWLSQDGRYASLFVRNRGLSFCRADLDICFGGNCQPGVRLTMRIYSNTGGYREKDGFDDISLHSDMKFCGASQIRTRFEEAHLIPERCDRIINTLQPLHHLFRGDGLMRMAYIAKLKDLEESFRMDGKVA